MKFLGKEFNVKGILPFYNQLQDVQKRLNTAEDQLIARPLQEDFSIAGDNRYKAPIYPLHYKELYAYSRASDTLRTILNALRREIFRNGAEIKPNFAGKCEECNQEYEKLPQEGACTRKDCNGKLKEPDIEQKNILEKFMYRANENKQKLLDVMKETEDDLNIVDDGFILFRKEYMFAGGEIKESRTLEILRIFPINIHLMVDREANLGRDLDGKKIYACPIHRKELLYNEKCSCGLKAYPACYKVRAGNDEEIYYFESEIIHKIKYHPSLTTGYPLVLLCWQKIASLMKQDEFILEYYTEKRPPKGLLFLRIQNFKSFQKAYDWAMDKFKENPHNIPPIPIENPRPDGKGTSGNIAEFINFMNTLDEMKFIEQRNEFRRIIGGLYGVMPLFQADIAQTGGLNQEGLQVTVTNRALQDGQENYNEDIFVSTSEMLGVTDWTIQLIPVEVKDELSELKIEQQKIVNARMMAELGINVKYTESGEFEFQEGDVELQSTEGGMTSLPGMEMPQGGGKPQSFEGETEKMDSLCPESKYAFYMDKVRIAVEKDEDMNIVMKQNDADKAMDLIKNIFADPFDGMTKTQSNAIRGILIDGLVKKRGTKDILNKLVKETDLDDAQAERIFRTERQSVTMKMREFYYDKIDPEDDFKYKWIGPSDHRETEICKRIKRRTIKGVKMEKLKQIIKEEGERGGFETRDFVPHINCRHVFVRMKA